MERIISDSQGADWRVTNIPRTLQGDRNSGYRLSQSWLCFTRADGHRVRVERKLFSGDWRRLSIADLKGMLAGALRAPVAVEDDEDERGRAD